ncbi:hypothetical protein ACNVED_03430 [Legionella sp. D16C41]|uniref:hypothetical protein n=1 Tax=Legionella sp. D16C41 TaxID=3402688 RepID=UPI003AF855AB
MRDKLHICYGSNKAGEVLFGCFHNEGQYIIGYRNEVAIRNEGKVGTEFEFPGAAKATRLSINVPSAENMENVREALVGTLKTIVRKCEVEQKIKKIILVADVNLLTKENSIIADYLINDDLDKEFEEQGILFEKILESGEPSVVKTSVMMYESQVRTPNSPVTLRTKKNSGGEAVLKVFPADPEREKAVIDIKEKLLNKTKEAPEADPGSNANAGGCDAAVSDQTSIQGQTVESIVTKPAINIPGLENNLEKLEISEPKENSSKLVRN